MPIYEVTYYAKHVGIKHVEAKSKKEAKEKVYQYEKERGGLHQFTAHLIEEIEWTPRKCGTCGGTGYLAAETEYCLPICPDCNCLGWNDKHILK